MASAGFIRARAKALDLLRNYNLQRWQGKLHSIHTIFAATSS